MLTARALPAAERELLGGRNPLEDGALPRLAYVIERCVPPRGEGRRGGRASHRRSALKIHRGSYYEGFIFTPAFSCWCERGQRQTSPDHRCHPPLKVLFAMAMIDKTILP